MGKTRSGSFDEDSDCVALNGYPAHRVAQLNDLRKFFLATLTSLFILKNVPGNAFYPGRQGQIALDDPAVALVRYAIGKILGIW